MIISHKHKLIFIKTKKTAGTSLEIALSKFLGESDIVTPISGNDESLRYQRYGIGCQNYRKKLTEYGLKDVASLPLRRQLARKYWNHISAEAVLEAAGREIFDSYYKFTIVRNPWDKAVSRFFWQRGNHIAPGQEKKEFRKYVLSGDAFLGGTGYETYSIKGIPAMDSYAIFGNLEVDLERISQELGLDENIYDTMKNIKSKGKHRPKKEHYSYYYDNETRAAVSIACAREISFFRFQFDQ